MQSLMCALEPSDPGTEGKLQDLQAPKRQPQCTGVLGSTHPHPSQDPLPPGAVTATHPPPWTGLDPDPGSEGLWKGKSSCVHAPSNNGLT